MKDSKFSDAQKAFGERLLRKLQREAPRRASGRRDLLQPRRSESPHRELAPALQHQAPALLARLQAAGPGSYHAVVKHGRKAGPCIRLKPDHSIGPGHYPPVGRFGPNGRANSISESR